MSSTHTQSQLLYSYSNLIVYSESNFISAISFFSCHVYFKLKFSWSNHMSVAEWSDTYGIHHWRIIWSSYRKLAWVEYEPTTTEFCSDVLTNWAIRPWVQLAHRINFVELLQFHCLFSVQFYFGYYLRQWPCFFQFEILFYLLSIILWKTNFTCEILKIV